MVWQDGCLFVRAAQGHSGGVGDRVDVNQVLEQISPGHPRWFAVGLRGTKLESAQSILRGGLDARFSVGREKRRHIYMAPQVRRDVTDQAGLRHGSTAVVS
eukprot:15440171-Alexandrium_andersonii.AAC.1